MGLVEILAIINGVLKFPGEVLALIKILQKTPQEKREQIMQSVQAESDKFAAGGRPEWD